MRQGDGGMAPEPLGNMTAIERGELPGVVSWRRLAAGAAQFEDTPDVRPAHNLGRARQVIAEGRRQDEQIHAAIPRRCPLAECPQRAVRPAPADDDPPPVVILDQVGDRVGGWQYGDPRRAGRSMPADAERERQREHRQKDEPILRPSCRPRRPHPPHDGLPPPGRSPNARIANPAHMSGFRIGGGGL